MNWSRGLFRAAIVLTVLWGALISVVVDTETLAEEICSGHKPRSEAARAAAREEEERDAQRGIFRTPVPIYRCTVFASESFEPDWTLRGEALIRFSKIFFLPPLLPILLGYALIWVGRGFRRSPRQ